MKLVIFGATGSTGRQIVEQALEDGHAVTAFVRDPAKLDCDRPNLTTIQGDVLDFNAVERAIRGQDAAICALGGGKNLTSTIRSQGTQNIIEAMEKNGVRRFICQSTLGTGDSWENLDFYWKYVMFGFLLRKVFADHQKQEQIVKQSDLDWTIVRPGAFVEGERTGRYRHGFPRTEKTKLAISRADIADFILKQLTDNTYLGKTPALSY
ncbi:MAG: SDR family oxidoreductase [Cyanobacteria bacterium P01_E01_bin.42]